MKENYDHEEIVKKHDLGIGIAFHVASGLVGLGQEILYVAMIDER